MPASLDPERVLADMQLALWPLRRGAGRVSRARPRRSASRSPACAALMRGDALIAEVHYAGADPWHGRLWFVNFEFGYSLTIDTATD